MRALSIAAAILFLAACTAGQSVEASSSRSRRRKLPRLDYTVVSLTLIHP
jgi:DMSO/TMAO reductase YedYZ heme-binding membrane subunit